MTYAVKLEAERAEFIVDRELEQDRDQAWANVAKAYELIAALKLDIANAQRHENGRKETNGHRDQNNTKRNQKGK